MDSNIIVFKKKIGILSNKLNWRKIKKNDILITFLYLFAQEI